jgi:transketolase
MDIDQLKIMATQVRRDIIRMVHDASSGHPGGSLGCAEYLVTLYFKVLRLAPKFEMNGINEDLFFLSNGHISPLWYSVLARKGFFEIQELATFRKINSRLQGHPTTAEGLPGIRMSSGSLGQGMSVAIGAALAKKLNHDDHLVFSLHGDGELQEGQNWEAAMFAAHHKVDNLISTIDLNGLQIDGPTKNVLDLGDVPNKFLSFGWEVIRVENGNDMEEVVNGLNNAESMTGNGKPVVIVMKTKMGFGVDFMVDDYKWHGVPPNDEQMEKALSQLKETFGDY